MNSARYLSPSRHAERLGLSESTIRRWRRQGRMPEVVAKVLPALDGELGVIDKAFTGWQLRRGHLISLEGLEFTPGEIRAIPLLIAAIEAYRAERQQHPQQQELLLYRIENPR